MRAWPRIRRALALATKLTLRVGVGAVGGALVVVTFLTVFFGVGTIARHFGASVPEIFAVAALALAVLTGVTLLAARRLAIRERNVERAIDEAVGRRERLEQRVKEARAGGAPGRLSDPRANGELSDVDDPGKAPAAAKREH